MTFQLFHDGQEKTKPLHSYRCHVTNHPNLNDVKQQPFYDAHGFLGSGTGTGYSGDDLYLLHDDWGLKSSKN